MKKALSIMVLVLLAATLLTACSDDSSPAPVAAAPVISANGGEGSVFNGGYGGGLGVYVYDSTNIKVTGSGSVNTAVDFSVMNAEVSAHTYTFGATPFTVATSTTIATFPTDSTGAAVDTDVAEGQYHMHEHFGAYNGNDLELNNIYIYKRVGSVDVPITGLKVNAGVTLTLGLNVDSAGINGAMDTAHVKMNDDFQNDGTITTVSLVTGATPTPISLVSDLTPTYTPDGSALSKGSVVIVAGGFALNNGTLTTKGTDSTGTTGGGNAGSAALLAQDAAINKGTINTSGGFGGGVGGDALLAAQGGAINNGTIIASGGNGATGGDAGDMIIWGGFAAVNTGAVTAVGGTGSVDVGGHGGWFEMDTEEYLAPIYNTATLMLSGGSGSGGGGDGGAAGFYTDTNNYWAGGDIVNTGSIIANGGDATTLGNGGNHGWSIQFETYGSNIRNTGAIEMKGGKGMGVGSSGGDAGRIDVWTDGGYEAANSDSVVSGNVQWTGSILADGGTGEYGGSGGDIYFGNSNNNGPYGGTIELIGYSNVNLKGGKGATYGGPGGWADLYYNGSSAPGTIYNDVAFDLSGGEGVTTYGGDGGEFFAQNSYDWWNNWKPGAKTDVSSATVGIENYGSITTKGGQGKLNGGSASGNYYGQSIGMITERSIINTGTLNASGGLATTTTGTAGTGGGDGGFVNLDAVGNVSNTGAIVTSGGNANFDGGDAGSVDLVANYGINTNTGAITANGGNATASLAGSTAGSGGDIYIANWNSNQIEASSALTLLSAEAGTGAIAGSDGSIYVGLD